MTLRLFARMHSSSQKKDPARGRVSGKESMINCVNAMLRSGLTCGIPVREPFESVHRKVQSCAADGRCVHPRSGSSPRHFFLVRHPRFACIQTLPEHATGLNDRENRPFEEPQDTSPMFSDGEWLVTEVLHCGRSFSASPGHLPDVRAAGQHVERSQALSATGTVGQVTTQILLYKYITYRYLNV